MPGELKNEAASAIARVARHIIMARDYISRLLRISLERGGEKAVRAVKIGPQAQIFPGPGMELDALRGEQLAARERQEAGMTGGERGGDRLVLLAQDAAGRVHQATALLHQPRSRVEDPRLLRRELDDRAGPMAPLQVGITPQGAEATARRVHQHPVELAREALDARIVVAR